MNKQVIMLVMVIALVVLTGVQAIQINNLRNDVNGDLGSSISGASVKTQSNLASQPQQQAAPTMVGGC